MNPQPVIFCGGSGTRPWPLSREQYPKQLLALAGEDTLLRVTTRRSDGTLAAPGRQVLEPVVASIEGYPMPIARSIVHGWSYCDSIDADTRFRVKQFGRGPQQARAPAPLYSLKSRNL